MAENPVSSVISETIAYTFAELHVQGILYAVTTIVAHRLKEGEVALVFFAGFCAVGVNHHYREKRKAAKAKVAKPIWEHYNL